MTVHSCASRVPAGDERDAPEWVCPVCDRVWERAEESGVDDDGVPFHGSWFQPRERCSNCERCRWQPDVDCGKPEHPHCPRCSHCLARHDDNQPDRAPEENT